jgi:ubiquinone/menaquinone biosynthesis C-methylase UbiE
MKTDSTDKAYWDRAAQGYDAHMKESGRMYETLIQLIRNEMEPDFLVLDIGTGTGEIPLAIFDTVRQIEAIDYSAEMIKYASEKATRRGIETVTFRTQDSSQLPYEDEKFDAVLIANVLHVVPNPDLVLAEAHRVLKRTGKLIAPTYLHGETLLTQLISRLLQWRGHPIYSRYSSVSLKLFLERYGFEVTLQQFVRNIMPSSFVVAGKKMDRN